MRTEKHAQPTVLRLITLILVVCYTRALHAGSLLDAQFPKPITSAQYEKALKDAALPAEERPAFDTAFDAYVEDWQRLRDRTLRPLRVELGEVNDRRTQQIEAVRQQIADRDPELSDSPEQEDSSAQYARVLHATSAEQTAMRTKLRQAYDRVGQLDARLLGALRAGPRTPEQSRAIDALAQERAARLASAVVRSAGVWRNGPLLARMPSAPKNLDPKVAAAFADRMDKLQRDSLPLLQRLTQVFLADGDQDEAERAAGDALVALRLKAIGEIGATLPAESGAAWMDSARAGMLQGVILDAERVPTAAIVEAIGDRMDEAARRRLTRWTAERQAIENELMGVAGDWSVHHERSEALRALNLQAMKDLAETTGTPALLEEGFVMRANIKAMQDMDSAERRSRSEDDDSALGSMEQRMTARLNEMNEASDDGAAPETPAGAQEASMQAMQQRPLQRPQVNRLRDALGILDEQRAVWDALVDDLMEASTALHESKALKASDIEDIEGELNPKEVMAKLFFSSEYRNEQQALESRWFDSITATFTSIPQATLAEQRSRWTFRRLRELGGVSRIFGLMTGDRSVDLDHDAAIDRLPSAIRSSLAPQVLASRERRIRDLQASIESTESFMRSMAKLSEGLTMGQQPDPEQMKELIKTQQDFMAATQKRAAQAAAAQRDEVEAMANSLPAGAAGVLRRSISALQYPEVFRPMQRTDGMIERVMSLPDLSVKQLAALDAEVDIFRVKSDAVAERAIATITEADKAQADSMYGLGDSSDPQATMAKFARMKTSEMAAADLDYDRSELSARTLRRLRALLTPEQAAAAKLD